MSSTLFAFLQWFANPRRSPLARIHMFTVSSCLRKYGLRYDDLHDLYFDLDIKEALARLPSEVVDVRHQGLKRAIDLSLKHQCLPDDLQVKMEAAERQAPGGLPLYERTLLRRIAPTNMFPASWAGGGVRYYSSSTEGRKGKTYPVQTRGMVDRLAMATMAA